MLRRHHIQGLSPLDAIIAATALDYGASLITKNVKHFRAIEGLLVFDIPDE